jgi:hypothetical protein
MEPQKQASKKVSGVVSDEKCKSYNNYNDNNIIMQKSSHKRAHANEHTTTCSNDKSNSSNSSTFQSEPPRHDLKIIIAKKHSSKNSKKFDGGINKLKLNKPSNDSCYISKVLNDSDVRLRGNVDNFTSSDIASTSEMKTTLSKKTGTVSHHDLKLENKSSSSSNTKKQHNDSHDFYEFTLNEGEKEKCDFIIEKQQKQHQKRESTKHTNASFSPSSTSSSSSSSSAAMTGRYDEKFKVKSNLSLKNIPKLKIELPSLKTKIQKPKTPNESYVISKSPFTYSKCEPQIKKVRFDISNTSPKSKSNGDRLYEFNDDDDDNDDDDETESNCVDQKKYAEKIGLKPVERKVESIILHRKRKKSKHSKEIEHSSKKQKLHVSSSLDESLKLKLKIMGGKNSKNDKKFNNEEEAYERTCNLKAVACKSADLSSINVQKQHDMKHAKKHEQEMKQKEAVVELENHTKYSVAEQKITKNSDSNQPMVFIPKLVLQKTTSTITTNTPSTSPSSTSSSLDSCNNKNNNINNNNNNNNINVKSKKEETTQVQRRNSILSEPQHKQQNQQQEKESSSLLSDVDKSNDIKIKIKPLDKLSDEKTSQENPQQQKLMKPPRAKMGSPSSEKQAQITSTLASSPIRPNSIPASLKLSPISSPSISVKSDLQLQNQNLKRSLSLGAENAPHCYINPYAKTNTEMFTRDPPMIKIPPLIPTSPTVRSFYNAINNANNFFINNSNSIHNNNNNNNKSSSNEHVAKVAPVSISKVPNINVKDPIKLFPNACPSVEILKIPQAASIVNQQPSVKNIKLNRQMPPTTIPLEKIKQTAQNSALQKILPKSFKQQQQQSIQNNMMKLSPNYNHHHHQQQQQQQKIDLPHSSSDINNLSFNAGHLCQSPISQDISLERYNYELSKDIAKLDVSLSIEKNYEHWGKQKMQEFNKISDLKNFSSPATATTALSAGKNLLNHQMNLSVRNIPNPSALMMFRNQNNSHNNNNNNNNKNNNNLMKSPTTATSPSTMMKEVTVTSSTNEQCSDIEEILSKSTIAREKPFSDFNLLQQQQYHQQQQQSQQKLSALHHSKHNNDKKSIEKLTEYLRLNATAAKSKEMNKQDDDNNNNNASLKNDKNFNLIDSNGIRVGSKSSSMDVICIDS